MEKYILINIFFFFSSRRRHTRFDCDWSSDVCSSELIEYENYRDKGIIGVKIVEGDSLLSAIVTDGKAEFLIATKTGQSIRFDENQVRPMGRGTAGVKAIDLAEGDEVVGLARKIGRASCRERV